MTFRVGQKVVCVDATPCPFWGSLTLQKWRIYVVTASYLNEEHQIPIIRLAEDKSPHPDGGYRARRFRPVAERKTDISVFTEILRKATKPARTPAMSQHHRGSENV